MSRKIEKRPTNSFTSIDVEEALFLMQVLIYNQELYRIVGHNMKVSIYVYVYMSDLE